MACKLRCPNCKKTLKERGDHSKCANGTYIVRPKGKRNNIECNECGHISDVKDFI